MATNKAKSTRQIPIGTGAIQPTDEVIMNRRQGGLFKTVRQPFDDFQQEILDSDELLNRPYGILQVTTGETWPGGFLYDCFAGGFNMLDLVHCTGTMRFEAFVAGGGNMAFVQSVSALLLQDINGSLILNQNAEMTEVHFPFLNSISGDLEIGGNPHLVTVQMPLLANIGGDINMPGNIITGFNFDALVTWGGDFVDITGSALTEDDVNSILIKFAGMSLTGKTYSLAGGSNAAPTGAGATAKANLISDGNTVTTN